MIKYVLVALIPISGLAAGNEPSAYTYLRQMQKAAKEINYEGTFVYLHDGQLESMKIYHKVDKAGDYERILHLNGVPREVVRENDVVTCILPDNKSVVINKRQAENQLFTIIPEDLDRVARYYEVKLAGKERVAARDGVLIKVAPRDKLRYGYRLWLDSENSLLLKSELLNESGRVVEQIMFTEMKVVKDIPEAELKATTAPREFAHQDNLQEQAVDSGVLQNWKISSLPQGFTLTSHQNQHNASGEQDSVQHIILSDGLASVSVYIEKLTGNGQKFLGSSFMGATNIYGTVVHEYQITVLGEVPRATVQMVAESVKYEE